MSVLAPERRFIEGACVRVAAALKRREVSFMFRVHAALEAHVAVSPLQELQVRAKPILARG